MRVATFAMAAVLASAIGRVTIAPYEPNPSSEIRIYSDKSGFTLAHAAQMANSSTGSRPDQPKVEKLEADATRAAADPGRTTAERMRIQERRKPTAFVASIEYADSSRALKILKSDPSDESRRAMLRRRLSELQAERRYIEEEEYSLRSAVVEIEGIER